jgi:hypothetical protein
MYDSVEEGTKCERSGAHFKATRFGGACEVTSQSHRGFGGGCEVTVKLQLATWSLCERIGICRRVRCWFPLTRFPDCMCGGLGG